MDFWTSLRCLIIPHALWKSLPHLSGPLWGRVQKNPFSVRKILVSAILGPEMAAPIFYGHLEKCVLSAGKPVSIKFLVSGGGGILGLGGGGGGRRFYFYGRADFSEEFNRGRGGGRLSRPLSRFCFVVVFNGSPPLPRGGAP